MTGLGEHVSLAARLQQAACDGGVLVSKALLERLDGADAIALGLPLDRIRYTSLRALPGAGAVAPHGTPA